MAECTRDMTSYCCKWWKAAIDASDKPPTFGLEIGLFEGTSSLWFIENYFKKEGSLMGIDPYPSELFWRNMKEHLAMGRMLIENRKSIDVLPRLVITSSKAFDFVYIDGSHHTWNVLTDLVLTFPLIRVGGVIICDDYQYDTPFKDRPDWEYDRPEWAIDSFERCMGRKVKIEPSHPRQRIFRKVSE